MSAEIIHIIKSMNQNHLEIQIALQCAPLLTGIKISNLLIVPNEYVNHVFCLFKETPISMCIICKTQCRTTFLLYRNEELEVYLNSKDVISIMNYQGYHSLNLNTVLKELNKRYTEYWNSSGPFPHELGLLLGYPADDVIGFIENQGKNFLYTGYWKVYSNLAETMSLFQKYNQAKEIVIKMVSLGVGIQNIVEIYDSYQVNSSTH